MASGFNAEYNYFGSCGLQRRADINACKTILAAQNTCHIDKRRLPLPRPGLSPAARMHGQRGGPLETPPA